MKMVLGAIALLMAVPGAAQTAPSTDPHANHAQHHAAPCQQPEKNGMDDMQKHCRDMMKDHAKAGRHTKMSAADIDEDFNGNGHQGHNH